MASVNLLLDVESMAGRDQVIHMWIPSQTYWDPLGHYDTAIQDPTEIPWIMADDIPTAYILLVRLLHC